MLPPAPERTVAPAESLLAATSAALHLTQPGKLRRPLDFLEIKSSITSHPPGTAWGCWQRHCLTACTSQRCGMLDCWHAWYQRNMHELGQRCVCCRLVTRCPCTVRERSSAGGPPSAPPVADGEADSGALDVVPPAGWDEKHLARLQHAVCGPGTGARERGRAGFRCCQAREQLAMHTGHMPSRQAARAA